MAELNRESDRTVTENRIMSTKKPDWYDSPRICLSQIRSAETFSDEVEAKRKALQEALLWDYEDYDEATLGARPEGAGPKADVQVCGIGGCTLRVFLSTQGEEIKTGECKAANFCLKERFEAIGKTESVDEGRALHREIIDTCDSIRGASSAGNFCPKLNCDLSAGVSIDQVPGTFGTCPIDNQMSLEEL